MSTVAFYSVVTGLVVAFMALFIVPLPLMVQLPVAVLVVLGLVAVKEPE